jgi:hypothetical protein
MRGQSLAVPLLQTEAELQYPLGMPHPTRAHA